MTRHRLGRALLLAAALLTLLAWSGSAQAALGGPVIIGGDDLTDHGDVDTSTGDLIDGWLYLQRALENVSPKVVKSNDGSVAALGSADPGEGCCDAGTAIKLAAAKAGLTVTYYNDGTGIEAFFDALAAGTAKPKIIWISGTGAGNDIDTSEEVDALTSNAVAIADFVNAGGGLISHGSEYGWLFALLPGLSDECCGSSDDLYLTPAGLAAFPGVTDENVNAGPWHNHFEGNFGGLGVLVRSSDIQDSVTGEDAAVILGGASVTLPGAIVLTPGTATNPPGTSHTVTATVRDATGALLAGATVTFSVASGPNAGVGGTVVTNAGGQASFTYTSNGATGTDTITASFVDATGTTRSDTATKIWGVASAPPVSTPPADIGVTKTDTPDPVAVGSNITYTLVVTNHGPGAAPNSALGDRLPAGVTFVSVSTTRGSCAFAAGQVNCTFGTLGVRESATVTIVVRADQAGTITNTAIVGTTVADHNVGNNQIAVAVTTVQGPFTPPTAPEEPAQSGCLLTTGTPSVFAGVRSTVVVRARYDDGSPRAGVVLTLRGAGKARTARTNAEGVARFAVVPKTAGRLTVRGVGCGAALAVAAVRSQSCAGLLVTPKSATVGSGAVLTVRVRIDGRPAIGVRVLARGAGLALSAATNSAGVATLRGTATQPGVVSVTVPGVLTCSKRVGVSGAFQPPEVTG
jgi:uncharacterized repeat protein (TIGR01451 family)